MKPLLVAIALLAAPVQVLADPLKIRFGSCLSEEKPSPILNTIVDEQPDLFIFLGDNIYADSEDPNIIQKKYERQAQKPEFRSLVDSTKILAIWDDHDYGVNDGGAEFPAKEHAKKLMLDFWGEPKDSLRRSRPDGGIYTSYWLEDDGKRVHIILPDLRWNRTPLTAMSKVKYLAQTLKDNRGPYLPSSAPDATMLGKEQWQWLEAELKKPADLKIIGSSLQLLADFTGWESWANFPVDRTKLIDTIKVHPVSPVVIISGDTHWGEISRYQSEGLFPLYEVTSSGLNQEWKQVSPNKHRVGEPYSKINYGFIDVDWQKQTLDFGFKDLDGDIVNAVSLTLPEISPLKSEVRP